jgi:hypothetical protein
MSIPGGTSATSNESIQTSNGGAADLRRSVCALPEADVVHGAHRVLRCCVPGTPLPTDLSRLRTMLDAHMFGRDKRSVRDDAVRVAWQIDSLQPSPAR